MDEFLQTTKEAGHGVEIKRLSDNHEVITDAMGGLLMALIDLLKPISFSANELDGLESRLREELESPGGVFRIMVTYGRKT